MHNSVLQRISAPSILPELRAVLNQIVEHDWTTDTFAIQDAAELTSCLGAIFQHLGGVDSYHVRPFIVGWHTFRAAMLRLDHLQDDDPEDTGSFGASQSKSEQYNFVLACYALAVALLDDLDEHHIPAVRIRRLTRLWNDNLLRSASGQHRDLAGTWSHVAPTTMLDFYEESVRAKAGSIYVIGFGGTAMLATEDQRVIQALCQIGELYGTLLQYSDDIRDAPDQTSSALTLSQAYNTALAAAGINVPDHTLHHYVYRIYESYMEQMRRLITVLPQTLQETIPELFRRTFALFGDYDSND